MGNDHSLANETFLNDWVQIRSQGSFDNQRKVWAKKSNRSIQMEQYIMHTSSKEEMEDEEKVHSLRHNHPQLVASLHFRDQTQEQFCSSNYQGKLYIEKIPLTLQTVTDIPFPDALHIYSQALQGFHILASQTESGSFPISEEHIGINCESVCKVWMNSKYHKNYPSRNERILEERMVRTIIDTIEQNCDLSCLQGKPSPAEYIYTRARSPSQVRFSQAINLLRNYANQYFGGSIPSKLSCVENVGGSSMLSKNWETQKGQTRVVNAQVPIQTGPVMREQRPMMRQQQQIPLIQNERSHNESNYTTFRQEQPIIREVSPAYERAENVNLNTPNFKGADFNGSQTRFNSSQVITQGIPVNHIGSNVEVQNIPMPQIVYRAKGQRTVINQEVRRSQFAPVPINVATSNFVPVNGPVNGAVNGPVSVPVNGSVVIVPPVISTFADERLTNSRIVQQTIRQPVSAVGQRSSMVTVPPQGINQEANMKRSQVIFVKPGQNQFQTVPFQQIQSQNVILSQNVIPPQQFVPAQQVIQQQRLIQPVSIPQQNQPIARQDQVQKVNSKLVFIDKTSPNRFASTQEVLPGRISEPISTQSNDYSPSYYATYTSKLYDKEQSPVPEPTPSTNHYVSSTQNYGTSYKSTQPITSPSKDNKYSISLDDGMSSLDFLSQLKNMKFSQSTFKKTNNYDFGNTYDYSNIISNPRTQTITTNTQDQIYKVDIQNYTKTITDGTHHDKDLIVYGEKIEMTPMERIGDNRVELEDDYRISYEYQEGETPQGDVKYEAELVRVGGENGTYEEYYEQTNYEQETYQQQQRNYQQQTNYQQNPRQQIEESSDTQQYQSFFDRYAQYNQPAQSHVTQTGNFGQYQTEDQQYNGSPQEEYKVDFDPEILADLQRLKGVN